MSWAYPARSRSRSPRSRPPYTDSAPDMYRGEYDSYDRDRSWGGGYDRSGYDYRRGRSRSPPPEEAKARKRRRSMSPYDRDRYDPRPRYNDDYDAHSRGYGYSSPPRRGYSSSFPPARRPPPDPHTFDYPASLKQYAEWFRYFYPQQAIEEDNADKAAEQEAGDGSKPRNGIKSKWEQYKKDFAGTQLQTMFDHHRKSPWFAEKYDPSTDMQNLRMRVRKEGWRGRIDTFLLDLESGKFDPDLHETDVEAAKENAVNGEANGETNGQGEDTKPSGGDDDDMHFNVDDEQADASGKNTVNNKQTNGADEASAPPEGNQVMIRTIPPDIGRACGKISGFVYLALGDPLQKRNYYRAGWFKFRDDADMPAVLAELSEKKDNGSDAVEQRIEKVMSDMCDLGLVDEGDENAYEDKKAVVALDLYIAYLRAAFNTCYYCVVVTDHLEELQRKCLKHVRKPLSKALREEIKAEAEKEKKGDEGVENGDGEKDKDREREREKDRDGKKDRQGDRDWKRNDDRWLESLDSKIALLINRDGVDPRAYCGKSYDEELSKAVEPYLKQEDEGKFRCKTCQKLFKATSFVEKHIANKHPELVKHLEDPFSHPPQNVGNSSQAPPPQAYGLQAPPAYHGHGQDFGTYYGGPGGPQPFPSSYPPAYHGGGNFWEAQSYGGPPAPYGAPGSPSRPPPPSRRDESISARRLSDRLGGYAPGSGAGSDNMLPPAAAGLPPKPTAAAAALDSALISGNGTGERGGGRRGRNAGGHGGPPPPPPPDAKEDPRAAAGKRVSYHDMDLVAEKLSAIPTAMAAPMLPTVRLPSNDSQESLVPEGANKFSVAWQAVARAPTPPERVPLSMSLSETDSEASSVSSIERQDPFAPSEGNLSEVVYAHTPPVPPMSGTSRSGRLSRALTMPLPSQLRYLSNPLRSRSSSNDDRQVRSNSHDLNELSHELADSVQMMVQTVLQISPPQLLDVTKEQLSACSLSVPTSAMSAMLTAMKNLNYISANMNDLCLSSSIPEDAAIPESVAQLSDFDLGELLQSVGDSLSGVAAKAGVDLVLYHGDDVALRQVYVKGPENGTIYTLSHIVRQVLATSQPGDSIEIGLLVNSISADDEKVVSELENSISCTIRISHKFATPAASSSSVDTRKHTRPEPCFSTLILRRLLRQIGATLPSNLPPPKSFATGRTCDLVLAPMSVLIPPLSTVASGLPDDGLASEEPSVDQLLLFSEGLKGKCVTLYADAKGSFAHHLTSSLTAWGMDITHVLSDGSVDGLPGPVTSSTTLMPPKQSDEATNTDTATGSNPTKEKPDFIFIDDDIDVFKQQLQTIRSSTDKPHPLNVSLRKRPSLSAYHRPRSSPQVNRVMGSSIPSTSGASSSQFTQPIIVHFTCIGNYKLIKDIIQSVTTYHSHMNSNIPLPEIMVIPKPVGPRRLLTALHTAVTKAKVDPYFSPIATTPTSPTVYTTEGSFFHTYSSTDTKSLGTSPKLQPHQRPTGSRVNSNHSSHSNVNTNPNTSTNTSPKNTMEAKSPSPPSDTLAAASRKASATANGKVIPPISVLIVDDNPINQTILSTWMKKKGIKFDLANNGQDAVTKFRTGDFHLILMDIQMPIMDGIQATKEIRRLEQVNAAAGYPPSTPSSFEDNPTPSDTSRESKYPSSPYRPSVIILALTASSLQSDRVAALGAGCNDFLTKPVSLHWLEKKIMEWGSLKALQMYKGPSEAIKNMSNEQAAQARNVAERLHMPHGRSTPSPSRQLSSPKAKTPPPPPSITTSSPQMQTSGPSNILTGIITSATTRSAERSSQTSLLDLHESSSSDEQIKDLPVIGRRHSKTHASLASAAASIHANEVSSVTKQVQDEDA
ncbi:hypothetical protein H0H93_002468, partial [Arthromyces matolae]